MVRARLEDAPPDLHAKLEQLKYDTWFTYDVSAENRFCGGCLICESSEKKGFQFLSVHQCKFAHLTRHANSAGHIRNVLKLLGADEQDCSRPDANHFRKVFEHL